MSNQRAYLAFSHCLGIGPIRFKQLLGHFGSAEKAYIADSRKLGAILGRNTAEQFIRFRHDFNPESILKDLRGKNIQLITQEDSQYPQWLAQISDPPICLYVKGNSLVMQDVKDQLLFAVVGTRKPTSYGIAATEHIVSELAQYGFTIVSGMAVGIDSTAHWSAINNKIPTIAVLGCGVDIIYPSSNRDLYYRIIAQGGAVVSEFPPGQTVHPGLFIARNRIIAGMSRGILVVEGSEKSGSLITARYAGEQGRDVFAIPSPITSPLSAAPHLLIKNGAKMVTSVNDILEEYAVTIKKEEKENILSSLQGLEKEIAAHLLHEPLTIDDIAMTMKKSIDVILYSLSLLEIQGVIAKNNEGKFFIK